MNVMLGRAKYLTKSAVAHALFATGLLQLWLRVALRRRAVVLMYHRVLPPEASARTWSHPAIVVAPDTFDRHMRALRRYFTVLTPSEFQARLEAGGRFESRSCLVTIDDGWIDTYTEAWPVLRRHRVPALVFLPAAYIGTDDVFWPERLGAVLHGVWQRARGDEAFARRVQPVLAELGLEGTLNLREPGVRLGIMDLVRTRKRTGGTDPSAAVRTIAALGDSGESGEAIDRFIDWAQADEMSRDGITFGAHGVTHRLLTTLPGDEVSREVDGSRQALLDRLGAPAPAFSYPNGDWNDAVAHAVSNRFQLAFSTKRGPVTPASDRFAIERVNIHEDVTRSTPMFLARVAGLV